MDQIKKYREILIETKNNTALPIVEKETLVRLLNTLIRSNELIYRSNDYLEKGYNLGYFLIESQRVERMVSDVINSAEKLRAKTLGIAEQIININVPLGFLINNLLINYVSGNDVFTSLNDFKDYRNQLVHKLTADFSKPLSEIEASISIDYPQQRISELQVMLVEIHTQINLKLVDQIDNAMVAKEMGEKLGKILKQKIGTTNVQFQVL